MFSLWNPTRINEVVKGITTWSDFKTQFVSIFPWLSDDQLKLLHQELPMYLELADCIVCEQDDLPDVTHQFFTNHKADLPVFYEVYRNLCLIQPSNACCERFLSVFAKLEMSPETLESTKEAYTIVRYNNRNSKLYKF